MLLTDDEITLIVRECARGSAINRDGSTSHRIAKAVIAAYEAKLREQEPVCWITPDGEGWRMRLDPPVNNVPLGWQPLFEHPAPIPEGWRCPVCNTGLKHEHTYNCVAKLREQNEPVAEVVSNNRAGMYDELPIGTLLYTNPAPIPEGCPNATDHNPHFVGHVDDLFDEEVIKHAEFSRTDLVFIAAVRS